MLPMRAPRSSRRRAHLRRDYAKTPIVRPSRLRRASASATPIIRPAARCDGPYAPYGRRRIQRLCAVPRRAQLSIPGTVPKDLHLLSAVLEECTGILQQLARLSAGSAASRLPSCQNCGHTGTVARVGAGAAQPRKQRPAGGAQAALSGPCRPRRGIEMQCLQQSMRFSKWYGSVYVAPTVIIP